MNLSAHGYLKGRVEGNLLVIEGSGPWNDEAFLTTQSDFDALHKQLYGTEWAVLMIIHGDPIHTPEAAETLFKAVQNDKRNGRKASAIILKNSNYPDFAQKHISAIYKKAGEKVAYFNNTVDAKKWLNAELKPALDRESGALPV